jgi:hypothetical protein
MHTIFKKKLFIRIFFMLMLLSLNSSGFIFMSGWASDTVSDRSQVVQLAHSGKRYVNGTFYTHRVIENRRA